MRIRVWSWREAMPGTELDGNGTEGTEAREKTETWYCSWSSERGFPGVVPPQKAVWQISCGLLNAKKLKRVVRGADVVCLSPGEGK
jgi:hypothetical protein